jgi:hypothetical protein
LPGEDWDRALAGWQSVCGPFDALALYHRPQETRTGFAALLLREGRGVGFVRCHPDAARIESEFAILRGVYDAQPHSFRVAEPLAWVRLDPVSDTADSRHADPQRRASTDPQADHGGAWLMTRSLPNYPLAALRNPARRDAIAAEITEVLQNIPRDALPRPVGTPDHWTPAHGDLAPWNIRTSPTGTIWVIDWEDVRYAPPGADHLFGVLSAHTTFGFALPARPDAEVLDWIERLIRARGDATGQLTDSDERLLVAITATRHASTAAARNRPRGAS